MSTPTATPQATTAPTATTAALVTTDGPLPADPIPRGAASDLVNATSADLPPPPPGTISEPDNGAGIVKIVAPALGLDHFVSTLGVTEGQMDSPPAALGNHAVGWYQPDDRYAFGIPGEAGNAIFSAHESWNHMQGPFFRLHAATVGDEIVLEMVDGERRRYQVARLTRYSVETMPMDEVLWPSDRPASEDWITLYTCGGDIVYDERGYGTYLERDVLVAKWVGSDAPEERGPR